MILSSDRSNGIKLTDGFLLYFQSDSFLDPAPPTWNSKPVAKGLSFYHYSRGDEGRLASIVAELSYGSELWILSNNVFSASAPVRQVYPPCPPQISAGVSGYIESLLTPFRLLPSSVFIMLISMQVDQLMNTQQGSLLNWHPAPHASRIHGEGDSNGFLTIAMIYGKHRGTCFHSKH